MERTQQERLLLDASAKSHSRLNLKAIIEKGELSEARYVMMKAGILTKSGRLARKHRQPTGIKIKRVG